MRVRRIVPLAAVAILIATSCSSDEGGGSTGTETEAGSRDFVVALDIDADTLDPGRMLANFAGEYNFSVYDSLVDLNADGVLVPRLATDWTTGADASEWIFSLDPAARFASGAPVTADDVEFSFERTRDLQSGPSYIAADFVDVEPTEGGDVLITLSAPDALFPQRAASFGLVVVEKAVAEPAGATIGADAATTDDAEEWFGDNSAGSGPYMLDSWIRNERIVLRANPNYWRDPPPFETLTFQDVKDSATQQQLLESGDVEMADGLSFDVLDQLKSNDDLAISLLPGYDLIYMTISQQAEDHPQLSDIRVRQAIQRAIDYDGLLSLVPEARRPASTVPLGLPGADADVISEDLEAARQLLAEAGVPDGFDITVRFASNTAYGVSLPVLWAKLQQDLGRIGINVTLEPVDFETWLAEIRAGELAMSSSILSPDFLTCTSYLSFNGITDSPVATRIGYSLKVVDDAYQQLLITTDPAASEDLCRGAVEALRDDASTIPLLQVPRLVATRNNVTGVVYVPNKDFDFTQIRIQ